MAEKFDYEDFMKEGGRIAFKNKMPISANPYLHHSLECVLWDTGWYEARRNDPTVMIGHHAALTGANVADNPFKDDKEKSGLWLFGYLSTDRKVK